MKCYFPFSFLEDNFRYCSFYNGKDILHLPFSERRNTIFHVIQKDFDTDAKKKK